MKPEKDVMEHKANRNFIDKQLRVSKPQAKSKSYFAEFTSKRPGSEVLWSERSGSARAVQGELSRPLTGTASDVSRTFLAENRDLFGMQESLADLTEVDQFEWGGFQHVRYQQTYEGIPVFGGEMLVAADSSKVVRSATGAYYSELEIAEEKKAISKKKAIETALKDLGESARLRGEVSGDVLWYPTSRGFVKVYHLLLPTTKPLGDWRYAINVETQAIEDSYNVLRFSPPQRRAMPLPGPTPTPIPYPTPMPYPMPMPLPIVRKGTRGKVYLENPDDTPNLVTVMYRNLPYPYKVLDGQFTKVLNEDAAEAVASSQGTFYYDPSNTHFDEAQMYYSVEKTYAYFTDLEFRGFATMGRNGKMTATVHVGTNYDNAYYSLSTGQIYFGDGSYPSNPAGLKDLSKELDVIAHEFTHAVIDEYHPGINGSDGGALHEGTADYFAASLTNESVVGEYVVPGPGGIRDCNNTDTYPGAGGVHQRGKIWSGACWDLRKTLGKEVADYLIFGSMLQWTTTPTFKNAKDAVLQVDASHCGGEYKNTIKQIFETQRHIPV